MFRRADPDASVILLHIPKTAGTTLAILLRNHYGIRLMRSVGGGPEGRSRFARLPAAERGESRLYIGHQAFGMHEHIPRPCEYVTILREPVARIVSHYHHVFGEPTHYLHNEVVQRRMTLERYVENPFPTDELDNGQTRMLADFELNRSVPIGRQDRSLLESALRNLESRFCAVGLTERFDESMVLMADALGWDGLPAYLPTRVSARRKSEPLADRVRQTIVARNALDMELYEWVKARVEAAILAGGTALAERVEAVKERNRRVASQAASRSKGPEPWN